VTRCRLDWISRVVRDLVSTEEMRLEETVTHYSIPNFDEFGGATVEPSASIESGKLRVAGDELLVSRLNPRKQRVLITERHHGLAVCSGEFVVLRPADSVVLRFLYWRMLAEDTRQHLAARVRSVTRSQQRVDSDVIRKLWIDLPSAEDQFRVASYLDAVTARIDELIAEQESFKALLGERLEASRQMLLLGPDGTGVPEWGYGRLKRFVHIARGRFTHRPRNDPALYDGPYPFIQTGDIAAAASGVVDTWSQTLNERGLAASRLAPAGTLVMAIAANIGDVARLGFDACFPDSVVAVSPRSDLSTEYLLELIRALRQQLIGSSTLNTQLNINVDRIGDVAVPIPPATEQEKLLEELTGMASDVATAATEVDHQVRLLQEHRRALITAAVTGGLEALEGVA
jgi:type I restriction enzyme S subunit